MARLRRLYEMWGPITQQSAARQTTFTVPESERYLFQKQSGPSSLHHMVKRIMAKVLPDEPVVQAFQAFGDKDPAKWHPHVHCVTQPALGATLKLTPEKLKLLNDFWKKALKGYGCRIEGEVVVHYNYARGVERVKHMLRYLTRPCPGPVNAAALADNPDLLYFLTDTLHRFKWIRYYRWPKQVVDDVDGSIDDLKGMEKLAGEKIDWDYYTVVNHKCFDMQYVPGEYKELSRGFVCINSS